MSNTGNNANGKTKPMKIDLPEGNPGIVITLGDRAISISQEFDAVSIVNKDGFDIRITDANDVTVKTRGNAFIEEAANKRKRPYNLEYSEEVKLYKRFLRRSEYKDAHIAPGTLEMLARFAVMSRISEKYSRLESLQDINMKTRVYNDDDVKNIFPSARTKIEYKCKAAANEGQFGITPSEALTMLGTAFSFGEDNMEADVLLMSRALHEGISEIKRVPELKEYYIEFLDEILKPEYYRFSEHDIKDAYMLSCRSDDAYQTIYETYIKKAHAWLDKKNFVDDNTNIIYTPDDLEQELCKIEATAGVTNAKAYRQKMVHYYQRLTDLQGGDAPRWDANAESRILIGRAFYAEQAANMLILFDTDQPQLAETRARFIQIMRDRGYSPVQAKRGHDFSCRSPYITRSPSHKKRHPS